MRHYGERTAARSQVPLMQHIDEGLTVLRLIGASELAQRAYCLHPLVQGDEDLRQSLDQLVGCDPRAVALAMEYRQVASAYLSHHPSRPAEEIGLSPLEAVNQMLVADKVQNYKDFLIHHRATHPNAVRLEEYFRQWLGRLEVSIERFEELRAALEGTG